jgi:hypothetical protein
MRITDIICRALYQCSSLFSKWRQTGANLTLTKYEPTIVKLRRMSEYSMHA